MAAALGTESLDFDWFDAAVLIREQAAELQAEVNATRRERRLEQKLMNRGR